MQIKTIFHQYMAAFPERPRRAEELIYDSAITAALSGATRVVIKTAVEAVRIPTAADNLHALGTVLRGVADAARLPVDEEAVARECALIRREVNGILESVIYSGRGSVPEGVVAAFKQGHLDIPFSPSVHNRGEVLTARDCEGAVRFLNPGRLQLDRETLDFHADKMSERRRAEGLLSPKQNYLLVEQDVLRIPRGQYERWPLGG